MSTAVLKELLGEEGYTKFVENLAKPFEPVAHYFKPMDYLLYIREDVSYRSKWIDPTLEVLLHPYEERIIGAKISGFAYIVEQDLPGMLGPRALGKALIGSIRLAISKAYLRTRGRIRRLLG